MNTVPPETDSSTENPDHSSDREGKAFIGPVHRNVLATRHVNGGGNACALPSAGYVLRDAFALGTVPELGELVSYVEKFFLPLFCLFL